MINYLERLPILCLACKKKSNHGDRDQLGYSLGYYKGSLEKRLLRTQLTVFMTQDRAGQYNCLDPWLT